MAIFKSDGTVYKLSGPNQLMQDQSFWNGYALHNFKIGFDVKEEKKVEPVKIPKVEPKPIIKEPEVIIPEVVQPKNEPVVEAPKEIPAKKLNITKTRMWCLPAISKKDDLYGETHIAVQYESKFILEGVIIKNDPYHFIFWTTVPLDVNSIIYPMNEDKNWWQVSSIEPKTGGCIYFCDFSTIHPDFSG